MKYSIRLEFLMLINIMPVVFCDLQMYSMLDSYEASRGMW
jgi:hypothetical protein